MANKFQKSVMERLEQEARQQKRKAPPAEAIEPAQLPDALKDESAERSAIPENEPAQIPTATLQASPAAMQSEAAPAEPSRETPVAPAVSTAVVPAVQAAPDEQEKSVLKPVEPPIETQEKSAALPDLSEYLRLEPQRQAKNKTFYLDVDVIEAVKSAAKAQRITDSKLVCDILRHILLGEV